MKERVVIIDTLLNQCRRVVIEDGTPVEYALEAHGRAKLVGNIYLGRVANILPGMQAAFVDIGLEKNAFLPLDDMPPMPREDFTRVGGVEAGKRKLGQGREIIVQVVREPGGDKGARLTMNLTFPGKYVVLLPTLQTVSVSRHIEGEERRAALLEAGRAACQDRGMGMILRTAAADATAETIASEARALAHAWDAIAAVSRTAKAPALLVDAGSLRSQALRDLDAQIIERPFDEALESKLEKALARKVWLRCGGFLVIDRTEAMTVIDVNSGKFTGKRSLGETAATVNMEAAREAARLIRLRDIGGIIIVDFVDMESDEDREAVLHAFREAFQHDRAKSHVYGFTGAGLLEITRRPVYQPVLEAILEPCECCQGTGLTPSTNTKALALLREIRRRRAAGDESEIALEAPEDVCQAIRAAGLPDGVSLRVPLSDRR